MNLRELVQVALKEDIPRDDITTDSLNLGDRPGHARLVAKQELVLSGREVFELTFNEQNPAIRIQWNFDDADKIKKGETICQIAGPLTDLLKAERTALNFVGHFSGIATLTARFVEKVRGTRTKIIDTRKTTPGLRKLEKTAVRHGGGVNHRAHLSERILVKENHLRAVGGITETVRLLRAKHGAKPIEVEVTNLKEIDEALASGVEQLMFDNMSLEDMAEGLKKVRGQAGPTAGGRVEPAAGGRVEIEASGNMSLDRVESVAKLGVDFISVGQLTHSAPAADISLLFDNLKGHS